MSPTRRRIFILLTLLIPTGLLFGLEVGLRAFGFGQSYPLFVEVEEAPRYLRANPHIVRRFMIDEADSPKLWIRPVFFPKRKTPGTVRIVVQGGSTAKGYPYGYGASVGGMLQQRLQRTFPERKVEVISTAMCAVNSYTLLDFTDEIIDQDPDAVLIYAGHNEYVGLLGVGSGFSVGRRAAALSFLWARDLRVFQLLQKVIRSVAPEDSEGRSRREARSERTLMSRIVRKKKIPIDSPLYQRGLEQYRKNMDAVLERYRRAGIPVFVGTVVCNERDQPPFISGHGEGIDSAVWKGHFEAGRSALNAGDPLAALAELRRAVEIDDSYAEAHFLCAMALDRLGRFGEARQAYLAAKDRDELRFRAPEAMNRILREVAEENDSVVVEVQEALAREARDGIVGQDLMLEHLHPNLRGYFILADAFYEVFRAEDWIGGSKQWVSRDQAWREIPVTEVDRLYGEYRIDFLTRDWPFTEQRKPFRLPPATGRVEQIAQKLYRGVYEWPDAMRELLEHYRSNRDVEEAAKVAVLLAEAFPYQGELQRLAAELLQDVGRPDGRVYLERALALASAGSGGLDVQ